MADIVDGVLARGGWQNPAKPAAWVRPKERQGRVVPILVPEGTVRLYPEHLTRDRDVQGSGSAGCPAPGE